MKKSAVNSRIDKNPNLTNILIAHAELVFLRIQTLRGCRPRRIQGFLGVTFCAFPSVISMIRVLNASDNRVAIRVNIRASMFTGVWEPTLWRFLELTLTRPSIPVRMAIHALIVMLVVAIYWR